MGERPVTHIVLKTLGRCIDIGSGLALYFRLPPEVRDRTGKLTFLRAFDRCQDLGWIKWYEPPSPGKLWKGYYLTPAGKRVSKRLRRSTRGNA